MQPNGQGKVGLSRRAAMRRAGAASVAAGLALVASGSAAGAQPGAAYGIIGVWRTNVLVGPARRLEELIVFLPGGVLLTIESPVNHAWDPATGPNSYAGPCAGQWLQLPSGDVRLTAIQLNYNQEGVVVSVEHLDATVRYDGATDTFAGTVEWRETTPDGATVLAAAPVQPITGTPVRVTV